MMRQSLGPGADLKAALTEAHKLINDLISAEMSALGLTIGEADVLTVLIVADHAPAPTEIADWLSVTGASTTARLKRLERRGLITRVPNPVDKRSVSLHLTAEGHELAVQVLDTKNTTAVASIIDELGETEAESLTRGLREAIRIARGLLGSAADR